MPIVEIKLFQGRTAEQKLAVARAISDALVDIAGASPESVHVIFRDVERDDWLQAADLGAAARSGAPAQ